MSNMKNGILIYIAGTICCFTGCLIGGFLGGVIFGLSAAILLSASVGRWQLKKANARIDAFNQAFINTKIKIDE